MARPSARAGERNPPGGRVAGEGGMGPPERYGYGSALLATGSLTSWGRERTYLPLSLGTLHATRIVLKNGGI
jgi:hypothetical protein